ncbi:mgtC family protein, partial [Yersinia pestis PY-103]
MPRCINWC